MLNMILNMAVTVFLYVGHEEGAFFAKLFGRIKFDGVL